MVPRCSARLSTITMAPQAALCARLCYLGRLQRELDADLAIPQNLVLTLHASLISLRFFPEIGTDSRHFHEEPESDWHGLLSREKGYSN